MSVSEVEENSFVLWVVGIAGRHSYVRDFVVRIVRHRVRITGKARSNHVSLGLKYVYTIDITKPSEAPTI